MQEKQEEQELMVSQCRGCASQYVHECAADQKAKHDEDDPDDKDDPDDEEDPDDEDVPYLVGLEPYGQIFPGRYQAQVGDHLDQMNPGPNEPKPQELDSLQFHWEDFYDAIDSIPAGASCGPDGIPAVLLKMAKVPISRMFKNSVEKGSIPDILKLAQMIPIHKGSSRGAPGNYRSISLTSHTMKT